ncbi:MAG: GNAT family N-acetyltransferase [Promicromonosporaceae bacterium]|nr:GNAT family N-acetyltransferase [Promicromonosporaceae bacterium]
MFSAPDVMIRAWRPEDDTVLVTGFVETYNGAPWHEEWTFASAHRYLAEFRGIPRSWALLAFCEGEMAGAVFFHARTWQSDSETYIDEFFVFPDHQRRGVGTALLDAVRGYGESVGSIGIALLTDRDKPAYEFYRKAGLREGSLQAFMYG